MECTDAESALALVFDGDLTGAVAQALCLHLCMCSECCELFAEMLLWRAMGRVASSQWGKAWERADLSKKLGTGTSHRPTTGVMS